MRSLRRLWGLLAGLLSHSTTDHLFTFHLLRERANEWGHNLWVAALDFKKAFDSVEHKSIWAALKAQIVQPEYIVLLQQLYGGQTATVKTDVSSRPFSLLWGTKQGDPLSSLLFNALLQHILGPLVSEWQRKKKGVELGFTSTATLINLRFADGVLLTSQTLPRLTTMPDDIVSAAKPRGLELHPSKATY